VTIVATPLLLYYLFVTEIIGAGKAGVSERIDGAFLLVIVCMQSLAVLGGLLAEPLAGYGNAVVLLSMSYFGSGYVLYFVVVTVVTYRLLDGPIRPDDWTGPYWITMGAAAITTLAGTTLGPRLETFQGWEPYAPVIIGVTFLAWAIASWWIPLLLVVDIWKFLTGGTDGKPPAWVLLFPWSRLGFGDHLHTYAPTAWGRVFPMGMYTASTLNIAGIGTFGLLSVVPAYWGWFALVVWALTLVGMSRAFGRVLLTSDPTEEPVRGVRVTDAISGRRDHPTGLVRLRRLEIVRAKTPSFRAKRRSLYVNGAVHADRLMRRTDVRMGAGFLERAARRYGPPRRRSRFRNSRWTRTRCGCRLHPSTPK